eukprot:c15390_g1_i1.p1 GENE.c15390_g1_i1~~c15390_g1_i1.p1  ORF type:complete len:249 (+),score=31.62 c15390_g1_i1:162-908(+)
MWWGVRLLAVVCLLVAAVLAAWLVPVNDTIMWSKAHQLEGSFGYTAFLTGWIIVCLPSTPLEVAAGFVFPFWVALAVVTVGKNLGSNISFLIGRLLGGDVVSRFLNNSKFAVLRGLEFAIREEPYKTAGLVRVSALPIAVKNYGMAVLPCSYFVFFVTCLLFGMPFTIMLTFVGRSLGRVSELWGEEGSNPELRRIEFMFGVIGVVGLGLFIWMVWHYKSRAPAYVAQIDEISPEPSVQPTPDANEKI